ncbi:MAG: glycosyltransferase, partial [bacterium]
VRQFQSALVGGETHRDYLAELGLDRDCIELGYNAVGNGQISQIMQKCETAGKEGDTPYFLSVCRFAPEKNLHRLISAYAEYVKTIGNEQPWRLVLAGDGPLKAELEQHASVAGVADLISWPGFLPLEQLVPLYAGCGAFVLPSTSEPWGLVVNEAALCGTPLLLSDRCGATGTFLPERGFPAGWRFDPENIDELTDVMSRMTKLPDSARQAMGETARRIAGQWGPDRFAIGLLAAIEHAGNQTKNLKAIVG